MPKYAVGVDFGTLSVRALVAEVGTGRELADAAMDYPHAVMDRVLPDGTPLPPDWALQHPQDYLDCLSVVVPEVLRRAGVRPEDVIGLGVDFTSSTMLPVDADGCPLCVKPEFAGNPYAWVMLWKHHAAQGCASRMEEILKSRGERVLSRCGGKVPSELMLPRLLHLLEEAPEVCRAADRLMEAGDWVVNRLTGTNARSAAMAGYKAFWHAEDGYPSDDCLSALHPALPALVRDKLGHELLPAGAKAGELSAQGHALTGLLPGTAVAVAAIDAHAAFPAIGCAEPGRMLMILGTSACHLTPQQPGAHGARRVRRGEGRHAARRVRLRGRAELLRRSPEVAGGSLRAPVRRGGSPHAGNQRARPADRARRPSAPRRKRPDGAELVERQPLCAAERRPFRPAAGADAVHPGGGNLPRAD